LGHNAGPIFIHKIIHTAVLHCIPTQKNGDFNFKFFFKINLKTATMRADMFTYSIPRQFIQWHSKVLKDVAMKTAVFWDV
jgi:hypothetical protein